MIDTTTATTTAASVELWDLLPEELVLNIIFAYLTRSDLMNLLSASKSFYLSQCARHDQYWEPVYNEIVSSYIIKSHWRCVFDRILSYELSLFNHNQREAVTTTTATANEQVVPKTNFRYKTMLNRLIATLSSDSFSSMLIEERSKSWASVDDDMYDRNSPFYFTLSQLERRSGEKIRNLLSVNCSCDTFYQPHIILLGPPGAGRTSLQSRACMDQFPYEPVIGGDEYHLTYNSRIFRFTMTEFTGIIKDLSTQIYSYNDRDDIIHLLCFDVNNEFSLTYLKHILIPCLHNIAKVRKNPPLLVLVGLKIDERSEQKWGNVPISLEEAELFAKNHGCAVYFETSAKTGEGLGRGFWELMAKCVIGYHNFYNHRCEKNSRKNSCILS